MNISKFVTGLLLSSALTACVATTTGTHEAQAAELFRCDNLNDWRVRLLCGDQLGNEEHAAVDASSSRSGPGGGGGPGDGGNDGGGEGPNDDDDDEPSDDNDGGPDDEDDDPDNDDDDKDDKDKPNHPNAGRGNGSELDKDGNDVDPGKPGEHNQGGD